MGKKLAGGLFAGLLGAGIYAAYQKLDENKRNQLKQELRDRADDLKERAVDYAFYAEDAINDAKEVISDQMKQTSDKAKSTVDSFKNSKAKNSSGDATQKDDVDIVVTPDEAFGGETSAAPTLLIHPDGTSEEFK